MLPLSEGLIDFPYNQIIQYSGQLAIPQTVDEEYQWFMVCCHHNLKYIKTLRVWDVLKLNMCKKAQFSVSRHIQNMIQKTAF